MDSLRDQLCRAPVRPAVCAAALLAPHSARDVLSRGCFSYPQLAIFFHWCFSMARDLGQHNFSGTRLAAPGRVDLSSRPRIACASKSKTAAELPKAKLGAEFRRDLHRHSSSATVGTFFLSRRHRVDVSRTSFCLANAASAANNHRVFLRNRPKQRQNLPSSPLQMLWSVNNLTDGMAARHGPTIRAVPRQSQASFRAKAAHGASANVRLNQWAKAAVVSRSKCRSRGRAARLGTAALALAD